MTACLTYLEAASTGLASCLRAPSVDFPSEFVLNCCFEGFELGWFAEGVFAPFMAEDWADIVDSVRGTDRRLGVGMLELARATRTTECLIT
jgi:hypothetical protein